jgi:hypothetical protein
METKVQLFSIRAHRSGRYLVMNATPAFVAVLRTRLGCGPNSTIRIHSADVLEQRKNWYHIVPDEYGDSSLLKLVGSTVLAQYRHILLFDMAFSKEKSYENWILFNKRPPKTEDLVKIAKGNVPFLSFPYDHKTPVLLEPKLPTRNSHTVRVPASSPVFRLPETSKKEPVRVQAIAPSSKLKQLEAVFNSRRH